VRHSTNERLSSQSLPTFHPSCPSCFPSTSMTFACLLSTRLPDYVQRYWQVPYYYAGTKLYDMVAGRQNMESSYVLSRGKALEAFPMLKSDGLVGAVVYYDGLCFSPGEILSRELINRLAWVFKANTTIRG
jgi:hypothetical protein